MPWRCISINATLYKRRDVNATYKRHDVPSTLKRRCININCPFAILRWWKNKLDNWTLIGRFINIIFFFCQTLRNNFNICSAYSLNTENVIFKVGKGSYAKYATVQSHEVFSFFFSSSCFRSIDWFYNRSMKALIRVRMCAVWSWSSLPAYIVRRLFLGCAIYVGVTIRTRFLLHIPLPRKLIDWLTNFLHSVNYINLVPCVLNCSSSDVFVLNRYSNCNELTDPERLYKQLDETHLKYPTRSQHACKVYLLWPIVTVWSVMRSSIIVNLQDLYIG